MSNPLQVTRWEQCLIGTVLVNPLSMADVTHVQPEDMSSRSHMQIWRHAIELERESRFSYRAVVERLRAANELREIGIDIGDGELDAEAYLIQIMKDQSPASVMEWADNVVGASVKRHIKSFAALASLDAESQASADEILDSIEMRLYEMRRSHVDTGAAIGDVLAKYEEVVEGWRNGTYTPAFIFSTPGLARIIPFLEGGDFMLIAGRPGEGKSSILRFEAFKAALAGKRVVIFNLENGEIEYARYLIAQVTGIDTTKLRQPSLLTPVEVTHVKDAVKRLKALPLRIVTLGAPTVFEVIRIARKLLTQGFEIFMLDYIQLMKNGVENEVQDISISSVMLRGFALKHNVPVIAAAQLNREVTKRTGGKPQLSDLRGSGSLEQDALIVAFTSLLDATEEELRRFPQNMATGEFIPRAVPARLYVEKQRNGPVDRTPPFLWDKATNNLFAMSQ